jgi:hypothetical protein
VTSTRGRELVGTGSVFYPGRYLHTAMLLTTGEGSPSKWLGTRAHHPKDWTPQHSGHQHLVEFQYQPNAERLLSTSLRKLLSWPRGPMARRLTTISQLESRDCRFDPCRGHITTSFFCSSLLHLFILPSRSAVQVPLHGLPFVTCESVAGCEFSMHLGSKYTNYSLAIRPEDT